MQKQIHSFLRLGAIGIIGICVVQGVSCGGGGEAPSKLEASRLRKDIHVDLGDYPPGEQHVLHVGAQAYPLEEIPANEPLALSEFGASLDASQLPRRPTHRARDIQLSANKVHFVFAEQVSDHHGHIKRSHGVHAKTHVTQVAFLVPHRKQSAGLAMARGSKIFAQTAEEPPVNFGTNVLSPKHTAIALALHHPDLSPVTPQKGQLLEELIKKGSFEQALDAAIVALKEACTQKGQPPGPYCWYQNVPVIQNGQYATSNVDPPIANNGVNPNLCTQLSGQTCDNSTLSLSRYDIDPTVKQALGPLIKQIVNAVKNDASFGNLTNTDPTTGETVSIAPYHVVPGQTAVKTQGPTPPQSSALLRRADSLAQRSQPQTTNGLTYTLTHVGPQSGATCQLQSHSGTQVTLSCTNSYVRYLGAYVRFYDAGGNPVKADETVFNNCAAQPSSVVQAIGNRSTAVFLGILTSPWLILAIPVDTAQLPICFNFPQGASQATIMLGGLGIGGPRDSDIETLGMALTGFINLGLPIFFFAAAEGLPPGLINQLRNSEFFPAILAGVGPLLAGLIATAAIENPQGLLAFGETVGEQLLSLLAAKAAEKLLSWIVGSLAAGEVLKTIPFVGWAATAVNIATTAAQLGETTTEILLSPLIIENSLTVTHDIHVNVMHDPNDFEFPATATKYRVTAVFSQNDIYVIEGDLPANPPQEIPVVFPSVPWGGKVTITALFFSDTGWVAGQATDQVDNVNSPGQSFLEVDLPITESQVPLTSTTSYGAKKTLVYNNGQFQWSGVSSGPTQTLSDLSGAQGGLQRLEDITLNQAGGLLGYAWQGWSGSLAGCAESGANQYYFFQNISLGPDPTTSTVTQQSVLQTNSCGYSSAVPLVYQFLGDPNGTGNNLVVVPETTPDGIFYYLRRVALNQSAAFSAGNLPTTSYGAFQYPQDQIVVHPQGFVIGLNRDQARLSVIRLPAQAVDDQDAPQATLYGGNASDPSTVNFNANLLFQPQALSIAPDGAILVLEAVSSSQSRVRALDLHGNPIQHFQGGTSYALTLNDLGKPTVFLDIAVEATGYLYVLSYAASTQPGQTLIASDYNVDIYTPQGDFLVRTTGMAAGAIAVDLWRNLYSLNYQSLVGPNAVVQPSTTQWIPSTP